MAALVMLLATNYTNDREFLVGSLCHELHELPRISLGLFCHELHELSRIFLVGFLCHELHELSRISTNCSGFVWARIVRFVIKSGEGQDILELLLCQFVAGGSPTSSTPRFSCHELHELPRISCWVSLPRIARVTTNHSGFCCHELHELSRIICRVNLCNWWLLIWALSVS